jgi:hypothetical protein
MNYFAHGRDFIDDPYFLAGTAAPDWLVVSDRGVKVRAQHAALFVDDVNPIVQAVARGIAQHHHDDGWFHTTLAFHELSLELTTRSRALLPADGGFRASFLGHILVELLLDDALIAECPVRLDDYYAAMARLDRQDVERAVNRISPRPAERLAWFIEQFLAERFLSDYRDDARLLFRLNQVMQRANLPQLPDEYRELFEPARAMVRGRRDALLSPEQRVED